MIYYIKYIKYTKVFYMLKNVLFYRRYELKFLRDYIGSNYDMDSMLN